MTDALNFKYLKNKSTFAQHVVNEGHSFGPMNEIMNIVHYEKKGKMLDNFEKYYIYKEAKSDNQLNDRLAIQNNPIFETIIRHPPPARTARI